MILNKISPLCLPLVCLVSGIISQAYQIDPWTYTPVLLIIALISLWIQRSPPKALFMQYFPPALWFLLGAWRYEQQEISLKHFNLFIHKGMHSVVGIVEDQEQNAQGQSFVIAAHAINGEQLPLGLYNNKIRVKTRNRDSSLMTIGDTVRFDYIKSYTQYSLRKKQLLLRAGILTQANFDGSRCTILHRPTWSLKRWLHTTKNRLHTNLTNQMQGTTLVLFESIFLGMRATRDTHSVMKDSFQQWGIIHYLARSGLHLVIVAALWKMLLCLIPLSFLIKNLIILLCIIFYALMTYASISFIRALLLFCIYLACTVQNIAPHRLHIIVATGLLVLLVSPVELFFLDFQLSFGLTLLIALFGYATQ